MNTRSMMSYRILFVRSGAALALAACAGCAGAQAYVDAPSEDFTRLTAVQVAQAAAAQAELERQIEEDMKRE